MNQKKSSPSPTATIDAEKLSALKDAEAPPDSVPGERGAPPPSDPAPYGHYRQGARKGQPRDKPYVTAKERAGAVEGPVVSPELMRDVVKLPYDWAARQYGEHWALSDQEADRMTNVHVLAAEKYLGEWFKKWPELYAILLFHTVAIAARVRISQKLIAEQERPKPRPAPEPTSQEPPAHERSSDLHGPPGLGEVLPAQGGLKRIPPGGAV